MFDENGLVTTSTNTVTLYQLIPDTTYRFRVSAITQDGEQGAEVLVSGTTTEATGGRVATLILIGIEFVVNNKLPNYVAMSLSMILHTVSLY